MWEAVPLHLRQRLQGLAHQLVTPVQGRLKEKGNRRLLAAVRAAGRMQMTGAHWILLLTTDREVLGGPLQPSGPRVLRGAGVGGGRRGARRGSSRWLGSAQLMGPTS